MAFAYANFTDGSINYGNFIIDYATKDFIRNFTNEKFIEFDSFGNDLPKGAFNFLFIPGCTLITKGQNGMLDQIDKLTYPSYCLAGSLWYPYPDKSLLLRNKLVKLKVYQPDLSIVKKVGGIIGSRDRYTYHILKKNGINTLYTGCPTLFLSSDDINNDEYVLMSFGRDYIREQIYYAKKIARKNYVLGIVHEKGSFDKIIAAGWNLPLIDYNNDIQLYLSYFKNASYVITGRLHGLLPSIAFKKNVFYFGTKDSRTTILDDLGIQIHKMKQIPFFNSLSKKVTNNFILDYFYKNMTEVARSIFKNYA